MQLAGQHAVPGPRLIRWQGLALPGGMAGLIAMGTILNAPVTAGLLIGLLFASVLFADLKWNLLLLVASSVSIQYLERISVGPVSALWVAGIGIPIGFQPWRGCDESGC